MKDIEVKDLVFSYGKDDILKNISFDLDRGDFLTIQGENGSGKSTLIKLILKDLKKKSGQIKLFGKDIEDFDDYSKIGYVPQVNDANKVAFPVTGREFVVLNLYKKFNIFNRPTKKCYKKVYEIFEILNIENLLNIPFNQLSGGQAQKVMIARAMVNDPDLLILDEPTVGVDENSKRDFLKLLAHLNDEHKISILMISHEMDIVREFSKSQIRIKNGRIVDA
ncbi:metal ABC transporter ATP-binding protein [Anaerococcus hydrogenalis]|uniref:ABC transporter n=1 Tax=Anaerococcus hydrogenalis TaxID=33029 RepID=A0A2N6UKC8_9FIRM|nr:metal ABC transporter ATP-binding protein [Anaerococcus hydrogenalis]MDK7694192.1 metal ABC transporter ATP-binding protein [Anaerococcus hydrogenalis]MDK7695970.1 metal ABC transporter ATP-binding protein [Anaerococcus hydrogenalis]MDK7707219.1 metal ABC transporter ATP-binding protein [Anaerococcus hydrogenalis]PMC82246.1 ABC transporter [Anaerococcus hydrogenalis]